jgi:hypothetical protein
VTYGIFNLDSGNAIAWYDSADAAFRAALRIAEQEPEAVDSLGLMEFDDDGTPRQALEGQELINAATGVAA